MRLPCVFSSTLDGNILITEIVGTIDKVTSRKVFNSLKTQIRKLDGAPWANIILAQEWELSALEIDESLIEIENWVRANNRSHLVFVVGKEHAQIKRFTLEQYLGNNLKKATIAVFPCPKEAMHWLYQQGFSLGSKNSVFASLMLE